MHYKEEAIHKTEQWRDRSCLSAPCLCLNCDANCRQYLDKRLFVELNGSRRVIGVLRGYDVSSIPRLSTTSSCWRV